MKHYCIYAAALVLSASLLTGCGCTPQKETPPTIPNRPTTATTPTDAMPDLLPEESTSPNAGTVPENNGASAPGDDMTSGTDMGGASGGGNGTGGTSGGGNGTGGASGSGNSNSSGTEGRTRGRRMG